MMMNLTCLHKIHNYTHTHTHSFDFIDLILFIFCQFLLSSFYFLFSVGMIKMQKFMETELAIPMLAEDTDFCHGFLNLALNSEASRHVFVDYV